jgi:cytochrome c oxidase cbb3-type subunit 3
MVIVGGAAAVLIAGGAAAWGAYVGGGYGDLLRIDADAIPGRPRLESFAVARARPLYARHCASCHGATLAGDPGRGAPDLADGDWLYGEGRVSEIEQTLTHGVRSGDAKSRNLASMPAYATPEPYARYHIPPLGPADIRDVTDYLISLSGRPADAAAAGRGEAVFHGRGGCYDCHGVDAHGDGAIGAPNLGDRIWLYGDGSRAAIAESIAHGRAGACPRWIGVLSAGEIRALAVYVHDHGDHPGGPGAQPRGPAA